MKTQHKSNKNCTIEVSAGLYFFSAVNVESENSIKKDHMPGIFVQEWLEPITLPLQ